MANGTGSGDGWSSRKFFGWMVMVVGSGVLGYLKPDVYGAGLFTFWTFLGALYFATNNVEKYLTTKVEAVVSAAGK